MRLSEREARERLEGKLQQFAYQCGREAELSSVEIEAAAKALYELDGCSPDYSGIRDDKKQWYRDAAVSVFDAAHQMLTRED